jgi:hypothetical protein
MKCGFASLYGWFTAAFSSSIAKQAITGRSRGSFRIGAVEQVTLQATVLREAAELAGGRRPGSATQVYK